MEHPTICGELALCEARLWSCSDRLERAEQAVVGRWEWPARQRGRVLDRKRLWRRWVCRKVEAACYYAVIRMHQAHAKMQPQEMRGACAGGRVRELAEARACQGCQ